MEHSVNTLALTMIFWWYVGRLSKLKMAALFVLKVEKSMTFWVYIKELSGVVGVEAVIPLYVTLARPALPREPEPSTVFLFIVNIDCALLLVVKVHAALVTPVANAL